MSDSLTRARKALKRIQAQNEEQRWTYGTVGRLVNGVPTFDVVGRPGYILVTIRQANGAQTTPPARNDVAVPKALGLPVRMRMDGRTYVIDSLARREDLAYTNPAQQGDIHLHDNRYYRENEFVDSSAGAADAGKPVKLAPDGLLDESLLAALLGIYVALSGDQDVAGVKNFVDGIRIAGGNIIDLGAEGTWTPVVADLISGGNVATTAVAYGEYAVWGKLVYASFRITNINTTGLTPTGNLFVRNFPYPSAVNTNYRATGPANMSNISYSGYLNANMSGNAAGLLFADTISGSVLTVRVNQVTSGSNIINGSLVYKRQ